MMIQCQKCDKFGKKYIGKNDTEKKIIKDYEAILCEDCGSAFVKHMEKLFSMEATILLPEYKGNYWGIAKW